MTEAEWWATTTPWPMLTGLLRVAADRKWRLFSAGCCRLIERHLPTWRHAELIDVVEEFAESRIPVETAANAAVALEEPTSSTSADVHVSADVALEIALLRQGDGDSQFLYPFNIAIRTDDVLTARQRTSPQIICLLHDIFGPLPFREVPLSPEWLTSDVLALARGIYDEKAFDRMPILADALQDAGCDNEEVLSHCRAANWEHVRGCWALDLLLGQPWSEDRA